MTKMGVEERAAGTQSDASVDFGIITALPLERDAIRNRLEAVVTRVFPDDPHTYYEGRLSIPESDDESYRVVLVMQNAMGNVEASSAATRLIARWRPRHVVMVGIAGGVRSKVEVGDVIVSEFCHYYEPSKQTDKGSESRPRQFPSNPTLLGRARAFEASDWRSDLRVGRPVAHAEPETRPAVYFGAIAAGEKVVADEQFLAQLQEECARLHAVAMEGAGASSAALDSNTPFLEIRGISDYADPTKADDGWRPYAANAAAAFLVGFLRSRPVPPASSEATQVNQIPSRPLAVLCMQSLRAIGPSELVEALDSASRVRPREFVSLDFTDLIDKGVMVDPETGVRRLTDPAGPLQTVLARRSDVDFAFQGLCHIPLAMLAGHLVTDRQAVALYDFHPTVSNTWAWPDPDGAAFPDLAVSGMEGVVRGAEEVLITISTSYEADPQAARRVSTQISSVVGLAVATPERGIVRSARQVLVYGRIFRGVIDRVASRAPSCRRIHVCYAGPTALAFHIGQQISENIHPPVVSWNYRRGTGYEWGLDLVTARQRQPGIVMPSRERA